MNVPRLPARLASALALAAALLAPVGGLAAGVALAQRANAPGLLEVVIADPATAPGGIEPLRSAGGFTGFDGPTALGGSVVRTGQMSATEGGRFEVTGDGATMAARTTNSTRLFRIERAATPLRAGDAVQVRLDGAGAPLGVLRLPFDLHEGANRGAVPPAAAPGAAAR
ncbi:MAG: hypothetical protein EXR64_03480 [Dehalococcoidia bacterium]|nr:hypothetical protein [Dehalococcoidia bacterium]